MYESNDWTVFVGDDILYRGLREAAYRTAITYNLDLQTAGIVTEDTIFAVVAPPAPEARP